MKYKPSSEPKVSINKNTMSGVIQKGSSVIIMLFLIIVLSIATPNFFQLNNVLNIMKQIAIIGCMAIGQTLVILTAGIDLSVASVVSFSGCLMVVSNASWGLPSGVAIIIGIVGGTLVGFINGLIIVKGKIPPFIATMGTLGAVEGFALITTGGKTFGCDDKVINFLGSEKIIGGLPISFIVFIIIAAVGWIMLNKTTFGRNLIAIGGNEEASLRSGINVQITKLGVYTLSAFFCSLSGLLMVGRLVSSSAIMAKGLELNTVAGAVLGGTSLAGGIGGIGGTVIGVLTIGILNNGQDLLNITANIQKVVLGVVIVAVVIFDTKRSAKFRD